MIGQILGLIERQLDGQFYRYLLRQIDINLDEQFLYIQMDRQLDSQDGLSEQKIIGQIDRQLDGYIYIQMDRQLDIQIDRQIDSWIDSFINIWMERQIIGYICINFDLFRYLDR